MRERMKSYYLILNWVDMRILSYYAFDDEQKEGDWSHKVIKSENHSVTEVLLVGELKNKRRHSRSNKKIRSVLEILNCAQIMILRVLWSVLLEE